MLVKVIPVFPIPGILPKNKNIIDEMVLDLNKNEIRHCMQYGNVYDENGSIIDKIYLNKMDSIRKIVKKSIPEASKQVTLEPEKIVKDVIIKDVKEETEVIVDEVKPEYSLNILSIEEDDYIMINTEFNTNVDRLEGSMYGLFDITKGPRPSVIEYKNGEEWVAFPKKFADFSELKDGDKLAFRILPKNNSAFTFSISIKEKSTVIASVVETISFNK